MFLLQTPECVRPEPVSSGGQEGQCLAEELTSEQAGLFQAEALASGVPAWTCQLSPTTAYLDRRRG